MSENEADDCRRVEMVACVADAAADEDRSAAVSAVRIRRPNEAPVTYRTIFLAFHSLTRWIVMICPEGFPKRVVARAERRTALGLNIRANMVIVSSRAGGIGGRGSRVGVPAEVVVAGQAQMLRKKSPNECKAAKNRGPTHEALRMEDGDAKTDFSSEGRSPHAGGGPFRGQRSVIEYSADDKQDAWD